MPRSYKQSDEQALRRLRKELGDPPWLTDQGLDFSKFPIDPVLRQAMREDEKDVRGAIGFLQSLHFAGRPEAGIFLLGMLAHSGDDWKKREDIVRKLDGFHTEGCAQYLLAELRRAKSTNTTRRYLNTILRVLGAMPLELVEEGLEALAADTSFTPRMREKFAEACRNADPMRRLAEDYDSEW